MNPEAKMRQARAIRRSGYAIAGACVVIGAVFFSEGDLQVTGALALLVMAALGAGGGLAISRVLTRGT